MKFSSKLALFASLLFVGTAVSPAVVAHGVETPYCTETEDATRTGPYVVCTDLDDYAPYSIVHLRGTGFDIVSEVTVKITRPDGAVYSGLRNDDGSPMDWPQPYDTVTVILGEFEYDYDLYGREGTFLVEVGILGEDGTFSTLATHTFTDATTEWQQCSNVPAGNGCAWLNGALNDGNSRFIEGMSVPHRLLISAFNVAGTSHSVDFKHEAARGSVHAFDFLTSFEQSQAVAARLVPGQNILQPINTCAGLTGGTLALCDTLRASSNVASVSAPDALGTVGGDDVAPRVAAYEALYGDRVIKIYGKSNSPITGASLAFVRYDGNSNKDAIYRLTWTSASDAVLIEIGTHLAVGVSRDGDGDAYGTGKGASSIGGGPYGISVTSVDGGPGTGSNTISGAAVQSVTNSAQVKVVLDTVPNDVQAFGFTTTGLTPSSFSLDDDGVATNALADSKTFSFLAPGTYTVTMGKLSGYTYSTSACAGTPSETSSALTITYTVTSAHAGQTLSCTITNSKVTTVATSLVAAAANAVYGATSTTTLSATLTSGSSGVQGKSISFTLEGQPVGSAMTNAAGVATLAGVSVGGWNAGFYQIVASFAGDATHLASSAGAMLTISKASQTITFDALGAKTYGDAPFSLGATASSGLPVSYSAGGACAVSGATVTLTSAGTCTIVASQSGNGNYNAASNVVRQFTVNKAPQTITFVAPTDKIYGDAPFALGAAASSGLPVSYAYVSGPCSLSDSTVTVSGAGDCAIKASQGGDANYLAASDVTSIITIAKAAQSIDFQAIGEKTYGDSDFGLVATATSGLGVSFSYVSGPCTVSGSTLHITGAGLCTVKASQSGNANYLAAPDATREFDIAKAGQTITFGALGSKTYGDADFSVSASASSGLPVAFSATGPCSVSGTTVTITGAGECTITAAQTGDANYNAALDVPQAFTIAKAPQTISFGALGGKTYGNEDFDVTATASSGLGVTFGTTSATCSVTPSGTVTILAAGDCTIVASQTGNENYLAAPTVSQPFTIAKAAQTLVFDALLGKTFGDADFSVSATSEGPGAISYATTTPTVCSVTSEGDVSILAVGDCTIVASQAGTSNYDAAPDVSRTFAVAKAAQTLVFDALDGKTFGDADFSVLATSDTPGAISYSTTTPVICSVSAAGDVSILAAGDCTVVAAQAGTSNYEAAPDVPQTFTVAKAAQTLVFDALDGKTFGDADFSVLATSDTPGAISYSTTTPVICSVSAAGDVSILAAGDCTVVAAQAGTSNYEAAPDVPQTFTVAKAAQTLVFDALDGKTFGDADFSVLATSDTPGAISYSTTTPVICSVSAAGDVSILAAGDCTVVAAQAGTSNYEPAADVPQTFSIAKGAQTLVFDALEDKTFGEADFSVLATSDTPGAITYSTTSETCSVTTAGLVSILAVGDCTIIAAQAGTSNYEPAADAPQTFRIAKAAQTLVFDALDGKTFGDADFSVLATSDTPGAITYSTTTPSVCSVTSAGQVSILVAGDCTIVASQAATSNYDAAADVPQTFTVAKATQTLDFGTISGRVFGDEDFTVLATSDGPGAITYASTTPETCSATSAGVVSILGAGKCTIVASQAGTSNHQAAADVPQTFTVAKAGQTLTFDELEDKVFGDDGFEVSATSTGPGAITFSSSTAETCSVTLGGAVTILAAGDCTIVASQAGTSNHDAAQSVSRTFSIEKAAQTLVFGELLGKTFGDDDFTVLATSATPGAITYATTTPSTCSVTSAGVVTILAAGDCTIVASQAGTSNYDAAENVSRTFTVAKAAQHLVFGLLADQTFGDAGFTVSATSDGPGAITFSSDTPTTCSVSEAGEVTLLAAGECVVRAHQAGDDDHLPAESVARTFQIAKASQTLAFGELLGKTFGDDDFTVFATSETPGEISYATTTPLVCSVTSAGVVSLLAAGDCTVVASQAGTSNYDAAADVSRTFNIAKAAQTLVFGELGGKTFGDASFTVGATSDGPGAITFSTTTPGICSVTSAGVVSMLAAGECTILASQAGTSNYDAAEGVSRTFTVAKAATALLASAASGTFGGATTLGATLTWKDGEPLAGKLVAFTLAGTSVGSATTNAAGKATLSGVSLAGIGAGSYPGAVAATFAEGPSLLGSTDDDDLTVAKAPQSIVFAPLGARTYGAAAFAIGPAASSGLPVSLSASGPCTLDGTTVTMTGAGTCAITASQAGDDDHLAATSVVRSFAILAAPSSVSAVKIDLSAPQFSDTIALTATVSASETTNGDGAFDGTLTFRVNGEPSAGVSVPVSSASPTGSAALRLDASILPLGQGTYDVTATFTPTAGGNYAASENDAQSIRVLPEGVIGTVTTLASGPGWLTDGSTRLEYLGDNFVVTGGAPNLLAVLSQSLTPDDADAELVDYEDVVVQIRFDIFSGGTSCTSCVESAIKSYTLRVDDRVDFSTGEGYVQATGPKLNEGSYQVVATLLANGYIVAPVAQATFTVSAATGQFITGGGHFAEDSKSVLSGVENKKGNFGFGIKQTNKNLQGNAIYVFRVRIDVPASTPAALSYCWTLSETCRDVDVIVKSNRLTALSAQKTAAYPRTGFATGQISVQFVDSADGTTHYAKLEFGGGTFRLDLADYGPSNQGSDTFGFSAYRKDGSLFHQAVNGGLAQRGTSSAANQALLGKGNVNVQPSS